MYLSCNLFINRTMFFEVPSVPPGEYKYCTTMHVSKVPLEVNMFNTPASFLGVLGSIIDQKAGYPVSTLLTLTPPGRYFKISMIISSHVLLAYRSLHTYHSTIHNL
jgi:hypothetical protein